MSDPYNRSMDWATATALLAFARRCGDQATAEIASAALAGDEGQMDEARHRWRVSPSYRAAREAPSPEWRWEGEGWRNVVELDTTIARTTFTFTVLHRTDGPLTDIEHALREADEGHAVGAVTGRDTVAVSDETVRPALIELGNDGDFFDRDLAP